MFETLFAKLAGKYLGLKLKLLEDSQMDDTKPWFKSVTIWYDVLTIVTVIVGFVDVHFTGGKIASSPYYQGLLTLLAGIGIKGRLAATTTIG